MEEAAACSSRTPTEVGSFQHPTKKLRVTSVRVKTPPPTPTSNTFEGLPVDVKMSSDTVSDAKSIVVAKATACTTSRHSGEAPMDNTSIPKPQWATRAYLLQEDKPLKVVLRGIPTDIQTADVSEDLKAQGFNVENVVRMTSAKTKTPIPLVLVILPKDDKSKEILNLTTVCFLTISVETPRQRTTIGQCHRCQRFGHAQRNCTATARCVKCRQKHHTSTCEKPRNQPAKCANCGGEHPASYRGCPQFSELPRPRARTTPDSRTASNSTASAVRQGVSFARATAPRSTPSTPTASQAAPGPAPAAQTDTLTSIIQMLARFDLQKVTTVAQKVANSSTDLRPERTHQAETTARRTSGSAATSLIAFQSFSRLILQNREGATDDITGGSRKAMDEAAACSSRTPSGGTEETEFRLPSKRHRVTDLRVKTPPPTETKNYYKPLPSEMDLSDTGKWTSLCNEMRARSLNFTKAKNMTTRISIQPADKKDYHGIMNLLNEQKTEYHTFLLQEEKTAEGDEVMDDLKEKGLTVKNVVRMTSAKTKAQIPLVLAILSKDSNAKDIFKVNRQDKGPPSGSATAANVSATLSAAARPSHAVSSAEMVT
ncbi:uncharacterized protein LOC108742256 [Agrilus planipennis]|uniref:Uncharacterized protein LOC108742256 n=1 Tax=Agrilus planipennis TaxID=224129 RepID=A0A7F5R9T9_AGRPL|nr:uncharacterized protein LOC108742256 [Agrilus planipennis]